MLSNFWSRNTAANLPTAIGANKNVVIITDLFIGSPAYVFEKLEIQELNPNSIPIYVNRNIAYKFTILSGTSYLNILISFLFFYASSSESIYKI